jgi:hypothetical protein
MRRTKSTLQVHMILSHSLKLLILRTRMKRKQMNKRERMKRSIFGLAKNRPKSQRCSMENVRQVVIPIVAKRILENIFYLYVSFLSHFSI